MLVLNNKRVGLDEPITVDGITYPNLRDECIRDKLGVVFVDDPVMPDLRYNYVSENEDGSLTITPKSEEQIAQMKRAEMDTSVISPWQLRKVLNHLALRDVVEAAVASADLTVKDGWEFAVEFRRNDPLVIAFGAILGKSESELDELFILAATL